MHPADVEKLFQYLQGLKTYYGWSQSQWSEIETGFHLLRQRSRDTKLYLGIVGEFTTGKSTFINALLGLDVLKEDVLAGTTCAPTMICYGEKFDVEIHQKTTNFIVRYSESKGFFKRILFSIKEKLGIAERLQKQLTEAKAFIHQYTADETFAKNVSKAILYLPCKNPIFDNDIVIVDTPGINADNSRHQEVTEAIVRDLCDLAIVLTPAPAPCSQTLLNFIQNHLQTFHQHCICLASQIDRVRPRERQRQMKYISERFRSENINFSQIYPVAAYFAIHRDENTSDEARNFRDDFSQTMAQVCELLKRNKNVVLIEKANSILRYIINTLLQPMLQKTTKEVQDRYDELQRNQLTDFSAFLESRKNNLLLSFEKQRIEKYETNDIADTARERFANELHSAVTSTTSKSDLKKTVSRENIEATMTAIQNDYIQREISAIQVRISSQANDLLQQFKDDFNHEFRNLAKHVETANNDNQISVSQVAISESQSLDTVATAIENSGWMTFGTAAAGGIIGTFICPGLGTLIGAGIGSLLSSIFGKSLAEYQKDAHNLIDDVAKKWGESLKAQLYNDTVQPYFSQTATHIGESIEYFSKFRAQIEEIIKKEKEQQQALRLVIEQTRKDLRYFQDLLEQMNNNPKEI